jgi:hypothetical protein
MTRVSDVSFRMKLCCQTNVCDVNTFFVLLKLPFQIFALIKYRYLHFYVWLHYQTKLKTNNYFSSSGMNINVGK